VNAGQATYNAEGSWNQMANMLFFDQVPSGFEHLNADIHAPLFLHSLMGLGFRMAKTMSILPMMLLLSVTISFRCSLKRFLSISTLRSIFTGKTIQL
jgi:hypothetical protein